MHQLVRRQIDDISRFPSLSHEQQSEAVRETEAWTQAGRNDIEELFAALVDELESDRLDESRQSAWEPLLAAVLGRIARCEYAARGKVDQPLSSGLREAIASLYRRLGAASTGRHHLLMYLAAVRSGDELALFAELFADDPPQNGDAIGLAFSPLFERADYDPAALFPRLFDVLGDREAAPVVFDLANFLCRRGVAEPHPASDRTAPLAALLGELVQRLDVIAEQPLRSGQSPEQIAGVIQESTALAVSLCDALALCEAYEAIPKLHQALDLPHRRIRTEAAAALTRLGDKAGEEALIEMSAEPSARLRVLAYADELGMLDRIPPEHQSAAARAEAELAVWLGEPAQFGLPPTRLSLIDQRTLSWPGYDDPQECFLFQFRYAFGEALLKNVGIAGPLTHAFAANVTHLAPDELYALFAGWQAEHDDIGQTVRESFNAGEQSEAAKFARFIAESGVESPSVELLGSFFEERVAIGEGRQDGRPVLAIADGSGVISLSPGIGPITLGAAEAWSYYKGLNLLRTFNPDGFP